MFCDSSQLAYGAVTYLRGTTLESGTKCTFIMSKSKVAPIKPQTELLAAVLGAELSSKYHTSKVLYIANYIVECLTNCVIMDIFIKASMTTVYPRSSATD